ncbi:class I SAM-dependent methyltransferase [Sutcliffiella horikoshii]|uniref:class I SAM-dependent methyltransferase n=1 Tax=Sutcliffiella horikoshii TaxID=79883 RepID=UPI001CFE02B6|nr:class I SAM-dependent methyltransferase [Sutcliffiella horikoshii]
MENLKVQYKNSSNLHTRINIHELYSTNKEDWHLWLFEQYDIPPNSRILEVGCGDGTFWYKNKDRIPANWDITLSDLSLGMMEAAKNRLEGIPNIMFRPLNIEEILYEDNSFDVIIANHMLYHVPDRERAISEVRRVLKPRGVFYCSTIGKNHMREFGELVEAFDSDIQYASANNLADAFGIENGEAQLATHFNTTTYHDFPGNLIITDINAIVDYLISTNPDLSGIIVDEKLAEFLHYLSSVKEENDEGIRITKATGLFVSR